MSITIVKAEDVKPKEFFNIKGAKLCRVIQEPNSHYMTIGIHSGEPGTRLGPFTLEWEEMHYVTKGTLIIECGSRTYNVKAGDFICYTHGTTIDEFRTETGFEGIWVTNRTYMEELEKRSMGL